MKQMRMGGRKAREIRTRTRKVDRFRSCSADSSRAIEFRVPLGQARPSRIMGHTIREYYLQCDGLGKWTELADNAERMAGTIVLVDSGIRGLPFVSNWLEKHGISPLVLRVSEKELKNIEFLNDLVRSLSEANLSLVLVIGGGAMINSGAYIAEKLETDLCHFPTTLLAMADGAGGKVRANAIIGGEYRKHHYKSYYVPNAMYVDKRFIPSLPENQKKIGLVEIIKHGLFQSEPLYDYLMQCGEQICQDTDALFRAAMWAAELKAACLAIDPYEIDAGGKILRAGHGISDRIEEGSGFSIPHGYAVAMGIVSQLEKGDDKEMLDRARHIFGLFGIPRTMDEYSKP